MTNTILDSPQRMPLAKIDVPALILAAIGGAAVLVAYYGVFKDEKDSYVESRFWIGIHRSTATALVPFQVTAAFGYIVFLLYASGVAGTRPQQGILTYGGGCGLAASVTTFSLASVLWPILTKWYLDDGPLTLSRALLPASSLVLAAAAAVVMVAGAFEANLRWPAIIGVLAFSSVVVMADGVGWQSKLLFKAVA